MTPERLRRLCAIFANDPCAHELLDAADQLRYLPSCDASSCRLRLGHTCGHESVQVDGKTWDRRWSEVMP